MKIDLKSISLSPVEMVAIAICEHQHEHRGKLPKFVRVHSEVYKHIRACPEIPRHLAVRHDCDIVINGVPIIEDAACRAPFMMNWDGTITTL